MKNFKRLAIAAVVAVMAFGVTAFASTTASYNEGAVKLASTAFMTANTEYTVVLTEAGVAADDDTILYINQGTKDATFWTTGMGPKEFDEAGSYELTLAANGVAKFTIPVTVSGTGEDQTVEVGAVIELTDGSGRYIKYAQCVTVNAANAGDTLSITDGTTTKAYTAQTLGQILDGEWVAGASVSGTIAVGVITSNAATEFTVTVVPAS